MKNRFPLIAWAALPLTFGIAFADQPQRVQPVQPGQAQQGQNRDQPGIPQNQGGQRPTPPRDSGTNYGDVFLQKLAAQLGLSVDKLKAAAVAAGSATIDQGVKAGDFPSDRAAELKGRLNENPFALGGRGPGGPVGRGGHGMHEHGRGGPSERGPAGKKGGPHGMHDHDKGDADHALGGSDDTTAQGAAQDSNFTF